ncbi:hypothetical protein BD769DRAFT_1384035 [Suillus cothurnatus]|nr:hypothetical protein BD769DRAFT_1384035 [Suillus cothurnatus]
MHTKATPCQDRLHHALSVPWSGTRHDLEARTYMHLIRALAYKTPQDTTHTITVVSDHLYQLASAICIYAGIAIFGDRGVCALFTTTLWWYFIVYFHQVFSELQERFSRAQALQDLRYARCVGVVADVTHIELAALLLKAKPPKSIW